jgi:hypothetical protein
LRRDYRITIPESKSGKDNQKRKEINNIHQVRNRKDRVLTSHLTTITIPVIALKILTL